MRRQTSNLTRWGLALVAHLLIFATGPAEGCSVCGVFPHMVWVELSPVLSPRTFESVRVRWLLSKAYHRAVIGQWDGDGDGRLGPVGAAAFEMDLWERIKANRFFFTLSIDGEWQPVEGGRKLDLSVDDDQVVFDFQVVIQRPLSHGAEFKMFFADDSSTIQFIMDEEIQPVVKGPWEI